MNNLSVTCKYFICALDKRGRISEFSEKKLACFVAGGLFELQSAGCIEMDKNKIVIMGTLSPDKNYLAPLYEYIRREEPVKLSKLMETYAASLMGKELHTLTESVGSYLLESGLTKPSNTGLFGNKKGYIPEESAVSHTVDGIRSLLLGQEEITEEAAAIFLLLYHSDLMKCYFSREERNFCKKRLERIVNSPEGKKVKKMTQDAQALAAAMAALVPSV